MSGISDFYYYAPAAGSVFGGWQNSDGATVTFEVIARLDTEVDVEYFLHGGILPYVLRKLIA